MSSQPCEKPFHLLLCTVLFPRSLHIFLHAKAPLFVQGTSTADILWTLRWAKAVTDKRGHCHPVYVYEMDMLAKALDSVDRNKLLQILKENELADYFHLLDHTISSLSNSVDY